MPIPHRQRSRSRPGARRYNLRRIKRGRTYTIQEIADLFDIHKNAVGRWLASGLKRIDNAKPYLIHGGDLHDFLFQRQASRRVTCARDEFYCFRCRTPRHAAEGMVDITPRNVTKVDLSALCCACGTVMHRAGAVAKVPEYEATFGSATLAPRHITDTACHSLNRDMKGAVEDAP